MKTNKFEKMAEKWLGKYSAADIWVGLHEKSLAKLLRRVYRMGNIDGFTDGMKKAEQTIKMFGNPLGGNGNLGWTQSKWVVSTNKKRGKR